MTTAASSSNSAPSNSPSNDSWVIVSPSSTDLVESKNVVNESPDSQPKQVEKSEETKLNSQTESNSNINVPIIESEKQTLSEIADEKQVDQSEQLVSFIPMVTFILLIQFVSQKSQMICHKMCDEKNEQLFFLHNLTKRS